MDGHKIPGGLLDARKDQRWRWTDLPPKASNLLGHCVIYVNPTVLTSRNKSLFTRGFHLQSTSASNPQNNFEPTGGLAGRTSLESKCLRQIS